MLRITMDGADSQSDLQSLALERSDYLCPGETLPISNSLHLARLAAGYSACHQCDHRCETGTLPKDVIKNINRFDPEAGKRPNTRKSVCGVYLNELTRPKIENIVEHILEVHLEDPQLSRILVAHDWRPSSPDLAVGVVSVLRRWGCEIADFGQISRPCFDFAMSQFSADLGLFVTGGRAAEKVNGLDVLSADGVEWSHPGRLSSVLENLEQPTSRASRHSGYFQSVAVAENYESHITEQFPEVSSLRIAFACGEPYTLQLLGALLLKHGCEVNFHQLNFSHADLKKQSEAFRSSVRDSHVDVGFLIRSDGQSILIFDERGKQLSCSAILNLVNPNQSPIVQCAGISHGSRESVETVEQLLIEMKASRSSIAIEGTERFWFADSTPQCDAIHVVGKTLEVLSHTELPLSVVSQQQQRSV